MPSQNLNDLMKLYARRGVADWKSAGFDVKKRAMECLGNRIADNEQEAGVNLQTNYTGANATRLRFIPMPQHPPKRGFERSFFLPIRQEQQGSVRVTFELFFLVEAKNGLAFRFEPAHPVGETHDYAHVQLTQQLLGKTLKAETPEWLPVSYPAFPTRASNPLGTFLYMATAVHGYSGGIMTVLTEIFSTAGRPKEAALYFDALKMMLG